MKTLEVGKKYYDKIHDNMIVEVVAFKPEAEHPYITLTTGGLWWCYNEETVKNLLTEVLPYDDFKIDEPVYVWLKNAPEKKLRRYFAGTNDRQLPLTWYKGATSWTAKGQTTTWDHCIRASDYKEEV